jgi:thioredoxin 1
MQAAIGQAIHDPPTGTATSLLVRHRSVFLSGLNPAQIELRQNAKGVLLDAGNILHFPAILRKSKEIYVEMERVALAASPAPHATTLFLPQQEKKMGNAMEFTDANFQQDVLDSDVPVLVDFWAPWCGPCRMITPVIEELASENAGTFRVGKVNVDDNGSLAMTYNVSSIPAIMIFKGGQLVNQFMGVQSKEKLQQALDEAKSA